jgi:hypothetical protein
MPLSSLWDLINEIAARDPGLTPWAIIWRPLTGASEALIPDIPFAEFPDPLELAQPCALETVAQPFLLSFAAKR